MACEFPKWCGSVTLRTAISVYFTLLWCLTALSNHVGPTTYITATEQTPTKLQVSDGPMCKYLLFAALAQSFLQSDNAKLFQARRAAYCPNNK